MHPSGAPPRPPLDHYLKPSSRPLQAAICLIGRGIENIDGGLGRLGGSLHRVLPARSEMVTTLTAQMTVQNAFASDARSSRITPSS